MCYFFVIQFLKSMHNPYHFYLKKGKVNFLFTLIIILGCNVVLFSQDNNSLPNDDKIDSIIAASTPEKIQERKAKKKIFYFIKEAAEDTYGFDIYIDGIVAMNHSNIPGRANTQGFLSILSAENVANYIVMKMRNGETKIIVSDEVIKKLIVD